MQMAKVTKLGLTAENVAEKAKRANPTRPVIPAIPFIPSMKL